MKNLTLFLITMTLLVNGSCKKDKSTFASLLVGRWDVTARRNGNGTVGKWVTEPTSSDKYVIFNEDHTLAGNEFEEYGTYAITDGAKLTFTKKNSTATQFYAYKIDALGNLALSPAGPIICIEGCTTGFIKK